MQRRQRCMITPISGPRYHEGVRSVVRRGGGKESVDVLSRAGHGATERGAKMTRNEHAMTDADSHRCARLGHSP